MFVLYQFDNLSFENFATVQPPQPQILPIPFPSQSSPSPSSSSPSPSPPPYDPSIHPPSPYIPYIRLGDTRKKFFAHKHS